MSNRNCRECGYYVDCEDVGTLEAMKCQWYTYRVDCYVKPGDKVKIVKDESTEYDTVTSITATQDSVQYSTEHHGVLNDVDYGQSWVYVSGS